MPIRLSDYRSLDQQTIHFDFGEMGDLNVTFAPNAISKDVAERADRAIRDEDNLGVITAFLEVVTGWDMEDDNGDPLPLTSENVDQLGIVTIATIMGHIQDSTNADPKGDSRATVSKATTVPTRLRVKKT